MVFHRRKILKNQENVELIFLIFCSLIVFLESLVVNNDNSGKLNDHLGSQ